MDAAQIDAATRAAWEELLRQFSSGGAPMDFSEDHGKPPFTEVLAFDGFNLRAVVEAALKAVALGQSSTIVPAAAGSAP